MTYCAGWKYRDAVFLLADSAVTKSAKPINSHSSFGQLHREVRGEHVEEGLLKLVPLGPGTVAAFAGDVGLATSCLEFLRDALPTATSARDLLRALTLVLVRSQRTVQSRCCFQSQTAQGQATLSVGTQRKESTLQMPTSTK